MDRITRKDLMKLSKGDLAEHLQDFLTSLSPGKRAKWIRENMPQLSKAKVKEKESPDELLISIEEFVEDSVSGNYSSWINEYDLDADEDYSNFEEWTETFGHLLRKTLEISRPEKQDIALECFGKLFALLSRASDTVDILGNQGPPEDYIQVDFSQAIAGYARSLLQVKDTFNEVFGAVMPLAKRFSYRGGYRGLVSVLDSAQRKTLRENLWKTVDSEWEERKHRIAPREVDGLISIAEAEGDKEEVLSIKEQFAQANAFYLKDVLYHYEKKNDRDSVAKWAKLGLTHFGQHKEYVDCLVRAKEKLGDKKAVLEVKTEYFLSQPTAEEFEDLKDYAKSISEWDRVYQKLLKSSERLEKGRYRSSGLRSKLLLAEGREKEVLRSLATKRAKLETEYVKFLAKYCLARVSSGADLSDYPELKELQDRCEKERSDLYDWLRVALKNEEQLNTIDYAGISARMYRSLIDFHLKSGKSSRARYAAYYCSVVKQLSDLAGDSSLWRDLIQYMMEAYQKKRLIWQHLRDRHLMD